MLAIPDQSPEFLAKSPRGKVPFLGTSQGFINEADAILDYLGFPESSPLLLFVGPYDRGLVALALPETVVRPPLEAGIDRLDSIALARRAEWHWMFTATGSAVMCVG